MLLLSSGVMTSSENTGICCGPVIMASAMCLALTPSSLGAYLPPGRAPPAPTELWHAVQLVRKNSPPSRICSTLLPEMSVYSSSGIAGPGASDAM